MHLIMIPSGLVKIFLTQNLKARRVKSRLSCLALQWAPAGLRLRRCGTSYIIMTRDEDGDTVSEKT